MLKFLHTLLRPDQEDENSEDALVAQAANILQVGEFQLLQLAYREWYGEELPEALTDSLFADYMLRKQVSHWARHYARRILDWDHRGLLDADNTDYHRYDRSYVRGAPKGLRPFCIAVAVLVVFVGGSLWISHHAVGGRSTMILPPYFSADELEPHPTQGRVGPGS